MAVIDEVDSPRKPRRGRRAGPVDGTDGGPEGAVEPESGDAVSATRPTDSDASIGQAADGLPDLGALLGRPPTEAESGAWTSMSPSLRQRARVRLDLMRRWTGDRAGMKAEDAARIADVTPKRFYEMASLWKREPGLASVGAYASAPAERKPRLDTRVNAALQAVVAKVVAAAPEGASTESVRRLVEAAARLRLAKEEGGAELKMPSLNVVRAIIAREQHRQRERKLVGDSVAGDCCATTMLDPDGAPRALFCLIDRASRRILGHALGTADDATAGYQAAAARALATMYAARPASCWAASCEQMNLVQGLDEEPWAAVVTRVRGAGYRQFQPIEREKRFGSQFRAYVGDRVGRVVLRPTWTVGATGDLPGERFADAEAEVRAAMEVEAYNAALPDPPGGGGDRAPDDLVAMLRLLAE